MKSICIIGRGNVGTHLCVAFAGKVEELYFIDSRTMEDLPHDAELYIICVADCAVAEVAGRLSERQGVVAHTSGSCPMNILDCAKGRIGVFYPLMTFSKEDEMDYGKIPVFLEASEPSAMEILKDAASLFTDRIIEMNSAQRMKMHIASVFACNFANALWNVAYKMTARENVPFRYLLPLIDAAAAKLHHMTPEEAQTGPAKRGDFEIVRRHEDTLGFSPGIQEVYKVLSHLIISSSNYKTAQEDVID